MNKVIGFVLMGLVFSSCANKPSSDQNTKRDGVTLVDDGFSSKDARRNSSSSKSVEPDNDNLTLGNYLRQVAGVNVAGDGYNARVTIRGVKTIYGAEEPLFVVDGVPISGGLGEVNGLVQVRDIDRVTVLKDGSSTAIYGVRGGSGVIVIRTKKD